MRIEKESILKNISLKIRNRKKNKSTIWGYTLYSSLSLDIVRRREDARRKKEATFSCLDRF